LRALNSRDQAFSPVMCFDRFIVEVFCLTDEMLSDLKCPFDRGKLNLSSLSFGELIKD
jgi:hypothetical protein